jgi:hypothetical protein
VLAFEGPLGLLGLLAAWGYGVWSTWPFRPRVDCAGTGESGGAIQRQWLAWQAIGGFAVLVAASTAGSDARAKIVALVLGANVVLLGGLSARAAQIAASRLRVAGRGSVWVGIATTAVFAGAACWRAWPLLTIATPYDAIAGYLAARDPQPVIGLYSGSHVKPFVWRFYLADRFTTAENTAEVQEHCQTWSPGLLIKSSDTALPAGARALQPASAYLDPTTILVAAHYEESPNRLYFGGPYLPDAPGYIEIYELADCSQLAAGS